MWTTVLTGEIRPKDEAASWALARLPSEHRPVLELARGGYLGEVEDDWAGRDDEATAAADHMIPEIRELAQRPTTTRAGALRRPSLATARTV
jgi:hypothetical protein